MRGPNKILFLTSVMLCLAGFVLAQNKPATIDSLINRTNRLGLFNGNVLVMDHGKELYRKAIGNTDASQQTLLTDKYRFHIGSIAKELNAVAIMMLKEQGKLSLEDKVSKHLAGLPAWAQTIRIKNLLQYTSGLPDLKWEFITSDAIAMDSLKKITALDFEPGTQYAYNNSNTFLQRSIVSRISGMSFAEFVTVKMLRPLKMGSSLVDPDGNTVLMATSYNDKFIESPFLAPFSGWTAVTLDDFYKWEQSLENFRLISPASTEEILTAFAPNKQAGLGGGSMKNNKIIAHTHDGTAYNFQALLTSDSNSGRTVILMTNNKQNNLYDINNAIQNILDGKDYQQPKKSVLSALQDKFNTSTGKELLSLYLDMKASNPGDYNFGDESALNVVGYALLSKKRYDDAILIFEYNTGLFPLSGNVFDSLGEAYYNKGDKARALLNYKRSLELDPGNDTAKKIIAELK